MIHLVPLTSLKASHERMGILMTSKLRHSLQWCTEQNGSLSPHFAPNDRSPSIATMPYKSLSVSPVTPSHREPHWSRLSWEQVLGILPDSQAPGLLNSCSVSFNWRSFPGTNFQRGASRDPLHSLVSLLPLHKTQSNWLSASSIKVQLKTFKPSSLLDISRSGMQKEQNQHPGGSYCVISFVHLLQWLPFLVSSFTCFHTSLKPDFLSSPYKCFDHCIFFLLASPNSNLGNVAGAFGALVFGFQHYLAW